MQLFVLYVSDHITHSSLKNNQIGKHSATLNTGALHHRMAPLHTHP